MTHSLGGCYQPPVLYGRPQPASAAVANPRSLLQNWPQVSHGGHAEMGNGEPRGELRVLGFG